MLYPDLADRESGYALVMRDHLPSGWRGLLVGAFFAAYMSTVSTQLNWGTSYLVNDVYRRFVRPTATDRHLVTVSRTLTIGVMAASAVLTLYLDSVQQAWEFVLESGAGIGLVLIARWYWWRVTAISEIAAVGAAFIGFVYVQGWTELVFPETLLYLVPWTTVCWLGATWLTPADPMPHLVAFPCAAGGARLAILPWTFYRRARPGGPGWRRIAAVAGDPKAPTVTRPLLRWVGGCVLVYGALWGSGELLFGSVGDATLPIAVSTFAAGWLYRELASETG